MSTLLLLRPEPGWSRTAASARAAGWRVLGAPLFVVRPLAWALLPPQGFDALLLTSANAPRLAGPGLAPLAALPCFCVGASTAAAARAAALRVVHAGSADVVAAAGAMAAAGIGRALHLCGRERAAVSAAAPEIVAVPVYAADAVDPAPAAVMDAIAARPIVLLHSARAAARFAAIADRRRGSLRLAATSAAVLAAAGPGWAGSAVATRPEETALLVAAARLCDDRPMQEAAPWQR